MDKPDVDSIEGLSPAISIDQKTTSRNPRSTVGTVTEIYDYLRLLCARIGKPHCLNCGEPIAGQSIEQIVDRVLTLGRGHPLHGPGAGGARSARASTAGCSRSCASRASRARVIDGELRRLDEEIVLDKKFKHDISIVVDRLVMKEGVRKRLAESVEAASQLAEGLVEVELLDDGDDAATDEDEPGAKVLSGPCAGKRGEVLVFSEKFACLNCGHSMPELEPRIFSFNSPHGACPRCHGLGFQRVIDPELIVPDPSLSIAEGALAAVGEGRRSMYYRRLLRGGRRGSTGSTSRRRGRSCPTEHRELLLEGTGERARHTVSLQEPLRAPAHATRSGSRASLDSLERRYENTDSDEHPRADRGAAWRCGRARRATARGCGPESLAVTVGGLSIHEFTTMSARDALEWIERARADRDRAARSRGLIVARDRRAPALPRLASGSAT